jgi:sugar lactone lactonase YvrE
MTQVVVYDPSPYMTLYEDTEGNSWSDVCGTATMSLEDAPDGVVVDADGNIVFDALPGDYTMTIVRSNDQVGEQRTEFSFTVNCALNLFETYQPTELGDIYIDDAATHQVSFSF